MYDRLSLAYDEMMEDVDYEAWTDYLERLAKMSHSKPPEKILDLACGTGSHAILLAKRGYEVVGVDASIEMLTTADAKAREAGVSPAFYCQDMRALDFDAAFDTVFCSCDSINYLLKDGDIQKTFSSVFKALIAGGLFIFDMSSMYRLREVFGNNTFAANFENSSYIWESYWDGASKVSTIELTLYIKEDGECYQRFYEVHEERGYEIGEIEEHLKACGFNVLNIYESFTFNEPGSSSERIHFIAQKPLTG